jgi:hypothetical protein
MRAIALVAFFFVFTTLLSAQSLYKASKSELSFFSSTPMEDIKAVSKEAQSLINPINNEIAVVVGVSSFHFPSSLMEEHFNENYMESQKYKLAVFKGKINEKVDFDSDFSQGVTASGTLEMHGVSKKIVISGVLVKKESKLVLTSKFKVALKDFNIDIPKVVGNNIAEQVEVSAEINYELKQK